MGFAILQNARSGQALGIRVLGLVDRKKSKSTWWTSDDTSIMMNYDSPKAAAFAAGRLKRNNARVVPWNQAVAEILHQAHEIEQESIFAEAEGPGWDAHKTWR